MLMMTMSCSGSQSGQPQQAWPTPLHAANHIQVLVTKKKPLHVTFDQTESFILTLRWSAISSGQESGQRLGCEDTSPGHNCGLALRGGVHLTNGAFLPNTILKVSALWGNYGGQTDHCTIGELWWPDRPVHCGEIRGPIGHFVLRQN